MEDQKNDVTIRQMTAILRAALKERRGGWQALVKLSKKPKLTYRWLVALSSGQNKRPDPDMLIELARVLGFGVKVTLIQPKTPVSDS